MEKDKCIDVLLVDDMSVAICGIEKVLLDNIENIQLHKSKANNLDEVVSKNTYDLIIWNIPENEPNNRNAIRLFVLNNPTLQIAVAGNDVDTSVEIDYLYMCINGYLKTNSTIENFVKAIMNLLDGNVHVSSQAMHWIIHAKKNKLYTKLSTKETIVMNHLLKGQGVKDISRILNLHISTIATTKYRIFKKLGVTNIVELMNIVKPYEFNKEVG